MALVKHLQKCYQSPSKRGKALPSTTNPMNDYGYEKGAYFTYRGEDTGYFYTAVADRLSIFKSNGYIETLSLSFTISFGPNASVIDCIYFPLNEHSPGVVAAVFDSSLTDPKHQFYIAYVSLTKKRVLKKVASPGQINSLANILDGITYPAQVDHLNQAFKKNWPHIIGVSIYGSGAALTHLAMTSEDIEENDQFNKPANVIILGKTFLLPDGKGFHYRADDGREYRGKKSQFYVSKFTFLEQCGVVVMGFPFGGIYMVSLRTQRPYAFFLAEGVIEDIALLQGDDDPRGFFFLWFALSKPDKGFAFCFMGQYEDIDVKNKCFDRPNFATFVSFAFKDFLSFISLKTMLIDRHRLAGYSKDPDGNESITNNNKSAAIALFTWHTTSKPAKIAGALFDLNMLYTKRLPSRLTCDNTLFSQMYCVSGFETDDSVDVRNIEVLDLLLIANSIHSFVSICNEDKDQLFYPSAYSFCFKALTRSNALYLNVDSIQVQYLHEVSSNFAWHYTNPADICSKFHALGISALPYESNDKRFYLLSTLLKHGYHFCICEFISNHDTPISELKVILKWLNREVELSKENLDKLCEPLLMGNEVSHAAMNFIKFSEYLYLRTCQLVDAMVARLQKIPEEETLLNTLYIASSVTTGLYLYSIGIKFGITYKLLPQTTQVIEINQRLRNCFIERMGHVDGSGSTIVRLIKECMETVPDTSVWRSQSAQEWYPPTEYTVWLGLFLMVNLSKTVKATLFGYYLHDLNRTGLFPEDKLLDKGLGYLLLTDNDKLLAIKRRIEKMYKADERCGRNDNDLVLNQAILDMKNPEDNKPTTLEDFINLPLISREQVDTAKNHFLSLPYGIHLWNKAVIDKRRYDLIEVVESGHSINEPKEITESRQLVAKIQKQHPLLFRKNSLLPYVKQWAEGHHATKQKEPAISRPIIEISDTSVSRKRTIDEVIATEEDEFILTTPIKQGRKSIFVDTPAAKAFKAIECSSPNENDITMSPVVNSFLDQKKMTDKQWEKVKQITRTPPATPLLTRAMMSPEPSVLRQPTSILKSNKKKSLITPAAKRARLQFDDDNIRSIKRIPNNEEQKAPLPDGFTMEDSIVSEIEVQDEEPMLLDDSSEGREGDLSYGPVKLNFDNLDDDEDDLSDGEGAIVNEEKDDEPLEVVPLMQRSFEQQESDEEMVPEIESYSPEVQAAEEVEPIEKDDEHLEVVPLMQRSFEQQESDEELVQEIENYSPEVQAAEEVEPKDDEQDLAVPVMQHSFEQQEAKVEAASQDDAPLESGITTAPAPVVRRRRGKARDSTNAEPIIPASPRRGRSSVMKPISEEASEPIALRRGRSRSAAKSTSQEPTEPNVPASPRRGRSNAMKPISEEPIEPSVPASPRRGRPRSTTKIASQEAAEPIVPASPRRGRSRSAAKSASQEPTEPNVPASPRRGRPRNTAKSASQEATEPIVPASPRRGRPRNTVKSASQEAPEPIVPASPRRGRSSVMKPISEEAPEPIALRRGRSRSATKSASQEPTEPNVPASPRRGRPRNIL